ncbi:MAG: hypothetical protein JXB49_28015 [Bacteroidales bacterium]|nr:hypothetical protein [Bacteroidales bacterium]
MKNILISIGLCIGSIFFIHAQDYPCKCIDSKSLEEYFEEKLTAKIFVYSYSGNTIQYFNEWLKGDIYLKDGNVVKNKNLRYRGFGDQLIWARNSDFQTGIIDRDNINGFVLYNKDNSVFATFKNLNIKNENDKNDNFQYLQVLAEGDLSFYVFRRISMQNSTEKMFVDYIYYMYVNDKFIPVKLRRTILCRLLPQDKALIKSIIRKNRLNTRNETDMIKAVNQYNSRDGL